MPAIKGKRGPLRGPCQNCGEMYRSYGAKKYCSMKCYMTDPEVKRRLTSQIKKAQEELLGREVGTSVEWTCIQCGAKKETSLYSEKKKKYCNSVCYRAYMAARFDRFVANPETVALPQCYDEFLDREELPCLVEGCDWIGKHLGCHVNFAHGITASQLKEMAGFNRTTGLISKDLAQIMSDRPQGHLAIPPVNYEKVPSSSKVSIRLEGKEHLVKAYAIHGGLALKEGVDRYRLENPDWKEKTSEQRRVDAKNKTGMFAVVGTTCTICGSDFKGTLHQAALDVRICSSECSRRWHHENWIAKKIWPLTCAQCLFCFLGTYAQHKSGKKGKRVYCSKDCMYARKLVTETPQTPSP